MVEAVEEDPAQDRTDQVADGSAGEDLRDVCHVRAHLILEIQDGGTRDGNAQTLKQDRTFITNKPTMENDITEIPIVDL